MPDILLANEDITVLGPPETVEVVLDIGPTGTRGSQIFVGVGDPNTITIGQDPILNDMYINTSPGADYSYMYQYVAEPGGNTWIPVLSINPVIYSANHYTTFTSGSASITIPISNIVTTTGSPLTAENFSIQYSIDHDKPIASSMLIPTLVGSGANLVINLQAAEYDSGTWQTLGTSYPSNQVATTVHVMITIVQGTTV